MHEKEMSVGEESRYSPPDENSSTSTVIGDEASKTKESASLKSIGSRSAANTELEVVMTSDEGKEYPSGGKLAIVV